jgi:hypothetical protein
MKNTMLGCAFILISLASIIYLKWPFHTKLAETWNELGFPIVLNETKIHKPATWHATVILAPQYFNKDNLDRLFLWYSHKHPNKEEMLHIAVYTDANRLAGEISNGLNDLVCLTEDERLREDARLKDVTSKQQQRFTPWDAICWRQDDGLASSGGDNLWYSYSIDLNNPSVKQRIVIRGRDYFADRRLTESWEADNKSFKIFAIAYDLLMNVRPSSKYYTFSYAPTGSSEMQSIFTIRQDDTVPIPRNQVRFIGDQIGYVFMGWIFAVTTNGGKTWHKWDAESEMSNWQCCDPNLIQTVEIGVDGLGSMVLKAYPQRPGEVLTLRTDDYGQHWIAR